MKKSYLLLALGLGVATLGLSGCSNPVAEAEGAYVVSDAAVFENNAAGDAPKFNSFSYGLRYIDVDMTVTSGKISAVSLREAFSPMAWARLGTEAKKDANYSSLGDDVLAIENMPTTSSDFVSGATQEETATIYFAKHIRVGEYVFEGSLRSTVNDSSNPNYSYCTAGSMIQWCMAGGDPNGASTNVPNDLDVYLAPANDSSSDYKLGPRAKWYIDCLENDDAKILASYTSSTSYTEVTPNYPDGKKFRNEVSSESSFAASVDALEEFLVGKGLSFSTTAGANSLSNTVDSSYWAYNQTYGSKNPVEDDFTVMTGVRLADFTNAQLVSYFTIAHIAFASVEFNTLI